MVTTYQLLSSSSKVSIKISLASFMAVSQSLILISSYVAGHFVVKIHFCRFFQIKCLYRA